MAASRPVTKGLALICTSTRRAASSAASGLVAATAARSWPAKRTICESLFQTARTAGWASAFARSIDRMRPAGTAARTILPYSIPGSLTSEV